MKKLYTIALAAAVALSASAEKATLLNSKVEVNKKAMLSESVLPVNKAKKAATAGATVNDYAGEYIWSCGDLLTNVMDGAELLFTVTNAATGAVTISGLPQNFTLKGTLDLAAGTLTLPNKQYLGKDSYGDDNYFYLKDVSADGKLVDGASSVAATVGEINGTTIVFPEYDVWALGDYANEGAGWWFLTYDNAFTGYNETVNDEDWTDFCTGTMVDAWIIPAMGADPASYPFGVNIQKHKNTEGLYRVANPYMSEEFPLDGGVTGNIVFNIADPEFVTVEVGVYSGFNNGSSKLYFFNMEAYFLANGYTKEEVLEALTDFTPSTLANNVATINNGRFDVTPACTKPYVWQDEAGNSLGAYMHGSITFDKTPDGISSIAADQNGEAVYYNLQGVRVAEPANGIVIRVQNGKSTKVRF